MSDTHHYTSIYFLLQFFYLKQRAAVYWFIKGNAQND